MYVSISHIFLHWLKPQGQAALMPAPGLNGCSGSPTAGCMILHKRRGLSVPASVCPQFRASGSSALGQLRQLMME